MTLASRDRDFEVAANLARKEFIDLAMARHRGRLPRDRIQINRMAATFAKQAAAMTLQMPNEIDTLHLARPRPSAVATLG